MSVNPSPTAQAAYSSFPLLVADIGGTNVRFGWVANSSATLTSIETLLCADFAGPVDATLAYLATFQANARPAKVMIAIASVITPGLIKVTNNHWLLDRAVLAQKIGTSHVEVFNDFEAIAIGLPYLATSDYTLVGKATPNMKATMGVIGAGTGLGVAGIVPVAMREGHGNRIWQTICGEGGHVTLAATSDYQAEILRAARATNPHVSAERLISGIGLPTLRHAVANVEGLPCTNELNAEDIGTLGTSRTDTLCEHTMEVFCAFLGIIAGNLALTLGARGGVFIAGGIVPKLGDFFHQSQFRAHFETKGRYANYLRDISTPLITAPYPGLCGLVRHVMQEAQSDHESENSADG